MAANWDMIPVQGSFILDLDICQFTFKTGPGMKCKTWTSPMTQTSTDDTLQYTHIHFFT